MRSAKATRWSREAILALGPITVHDEPEDLDSGADKDEKDTSDKSGDDGGADSEDDDGEDPATLRKKLENRAAQAKRQDAEILRLKAIEKEADELRKAKEEQDRKGRSELENLKADVESRDKALAVKDETIRRLTVENAFMTMPEIQWKNPAVALKLVDLTDVEFDPETGAPKDKKQLLEAAKKLAKSDPYLVKSKTEVDDGTPAGKLSGKPPAGKTGGDKLNNEKLAAKYNIHR
jgi:nucleotide-binding universal stress UspA family protein